MTRHSRILMFMQYYYAENLHRGVAQYAREAAWSLNTSMYRSGSLPQRPWDGIVGCFQEHDEFFRDVVTPGRIPAVSLTVSAELPSVLPDNAAVGKLAAEHLLERGFTQFGFVGLADRIWSVRREEGFHQRVAEAKHQVHVYQSPRLRRDREWGREQAYLAEWLAALPKPIGVMACNDDRGRQVLEACLAAGLRVPEDIAVVGMDDDQLLCDLSNPPLSSVALDTEQGGYEAAALLDGLMSRRVRRPRRILVPPRWVVTRRSSDIVALDDRSVAAAVRYVREHAGSPIQVRDVVAASGLSRRTLEIRFQKAIGRSVHDEIQRVHLDRAKRFLRETKLPVARIA